MRVLVRQRAVQQLDRRLHRLKVGEEKDHSGMTTLRRMGGAEYRRPRANTICFHRSLKC